MKRFVINQIVSAAVGLAAFAVVGPAPALAQSRDHTGSMMPAYYDANGGQIAGSWAPQSTEPTRPLFLNAETRTTRHRHTAR